MQCYYIEYVRYYYTLYNEIMKKLICFIIVFLLFFYIIKEEVISQEVNFPIRINEVMPNPEGSDTDYEWIEVYNYSDSSTDLSTCSIDEKKLPEDTFIEANSYLVITRDLLDKDEDGKSYEQRWGNGSGVWGDNEEESYKVLELSISLSNSNDSIELVCSDFYDEFSWISSVSGQSYSFTEDEEWVDDYDITPGRSNAAIPTLDYLRDVLITEVYPSPDTNLSEIEWLEVYNFGDSDIQLDGWILKDSTKSMVISDEIVIPMKSYLVFDSDFLNFTLNNSGETISLYDPNEDLVDSFEYSETKKGISNIRKFEDGRYSSEVFQTQHVTYAKDNIYINPDDVFYGKNMIEIVEAHGLDIGDHAYIEGIISAELGILGEKVFYIQDKSGGIQIYLKDTEFWKDYSLFDNLEVFGEVKESYGEKKIYIESENSIRQNEKSESIDIEEYDLCDVGFKDIGTLVFLTGEITQTSGKTFFIGSGKCEIKVVIKDSTAIDTPDKKKGQYAGIVGIISSYGDSEDSLRILPRYASDILISDDPVEYGDVLAVTGDDIRWTFISGILLTLVAVITFLRYYVRHLNR